MDTKDNAAKDDETPTPDYAESSKRCQPQEPRSTKKPNSKGYVRPRSYNSKCKRLASQLHPEESIASTSATLVPNVVVSASLEDKSTDLQDSKASKRDIIETVSSPNLSKPDIDVFDLNDRLTENEDTDMFDPVIVEIGQTITLQKETVKPDIDVFDLNDRLTENEDTDMFDPVIVEVGPTITLQKETVSLAEPEENNCDASRVNDHEDSAAETELLSFIRQKENENLTIEDLLDRVKTDGNLLNEIDFEEYFEDPDHMNEDSKELDNHEDGNIPLQPGHNLTLESSVLLVWLFVVTHSLTSVQISDLLTLIDLLLMESHPVFKSLHRFKRFFNISRSPFAKHFYCNYCFAAECEYTITCTNTMCNKNLQGKDKKSYFLELPVQSQLTSLFSREKFRALLKHRQTRIKRVDDNMEDVYDSELYKTLSQKGGPLDIDQENNISFIFNTDGVPIFKSSKMSIWPIFLMINELPYRHRKSRENILLCGLWFGPSKPVMNNFCKPLHQSLLDLEKGIQIKLKEETIIVKGFLFCISCDIPARSLVMNMNQHCGEFSCPKCLHQGCNFRTATGGNIRVFPYDASGSTSLRIHTDCVSDAHKASLEGKKPVPVNGIKGPSFTMFCPNFDVVKNVGIDTMHLLYLGLVRLLVNLWFGVSNSLQEYSLYKYIDLVDSRLTSIRPSHYISRMPRGISDNLKFWKAAEFRSWFFYYSIPCVSDLLKPKYLYHYCALVEAIFLLTQSSVSQVDIARSERLINYFVFMMPVLYGERYMTLNIHSLLHLPMIVKELGPLWTNSCFPFESANGEILKLFHGTQYIDVQILNAVNVFQTLPSLAKSVEQSSCASTFVNKLLKVKANGDELSFSLCGKHYDINLTHREKLLACSFLNKPFAELKFYGKALIRGIHIYSSRFSTSTCRNSYTVKYINNDSHISFGFVCWFADDGGRMQFSCINQLEPSPLSIFSMHHEHADSDKHIDSNFMNLGLKFMHYLRKTDECCIVPLKSIVDLCISVESEEFVFVCEEPNHHELNL